MRTGCLLVITHALAFVVGWLFAWLAPLWF